MWVRASGCMRVDAACPPLRLTYSHAADDGLPRVQQPWIPPLPEMVDSFRRDLGMRNETVAGVVHGAASAARPLMSQAMACSLSSQRSAGNSSMGRLLRRFLWVVL